MPRPGPGPWEPLSGYPSRAVLFVAGSAVTAWLFYAWRSTRQEPNYAPEDAPLFLGCAIAGVVGLVALTFFTVWGEYPYNSEYHQWRTTSGTVTQVGSRLLGDDKSTTQRFVVTLAGVGQRACDDTRCAEVKVGDQLTLSCKRSWQYAGSDGYDCNFESDVQR